MTTILIDAASGKIVADRQSTCNQICNNKVVDYQVSRSENCKIRPLENGTYLVGTGDRGEINNSYQHFLHYGHINEHVGSECKIAVVSKKGSGLLIDIYSYKKTRWTWLTGKGIFELGTIYKENGVVTMGSGGNYAFAAYMAGCSPEESVKIAAKCDIYTSDEIDVVSLYGVGGNDDNNSV